MTLRERFEEVFDRRFEYASDQAKAIFVQNYLDAVCAERGHDWPTKIPPGHYITQSYVARAVIEIIGPCRTCGAKGE